MKIAMLAGSYKNAGDFLIVQRCRDLLEHFVPGCEITQYERRLPLDDKLEEINRADTLVFAGGPAYVPQLYPDVIPLTGRIEEIKPPFFAMAMGWKGTNGNAATVQHYRFSDTTMQLLKRFEHDGYSLGCRDVLTEDALHASGLHDTVMTGCAAWYKLDKIGCRLERTTLRDARKIAVSDPARPNNWGAAENVVRYLKKRFPESEIQFIFHRGIGSDQFTGEKQGQAQKDFCGVLDGLGVRYQDISYGVDGFSVYNDCDLHVGFRVHAHIYNMSNRTPTVLLEEDGRGVGADLSMGLPSIPCFDPTEKKHKNELIDKVARRLHQGSNEYLVRELDDWLNRLEEESLAPFNWAYARMEHYFTKMEQHLSQLR